MSVTNDQYAYLDQYHPGTYTPAQSQSQNISKTQGQSGPDTKSVNGDESDTAFFGEDGFGFDDFLDIINPLQHLPVISTLYREFTNDEISPGSRIIGGGIFGGGIGLAASIVNTAIETETGKDIGEHVIALFDGDEEGVDTNDIATASPAAAQTSPASAVNKVVQQQASLPTDPQPVKAAYPANETRNSQSAIPAIQPASGQTKLHMGLEWKSAASDLHKNIQAATQSQDNSLTQEQLAQVLGSFRATRVGNASLPTIESKPLLVPTATTAPAQNAPTQYEKQAAVNESQDRLVSDTFDYLDKMI